MPVDKEVIVVNTKTGGMKGSKLARFDLIPAQFLWDLATHYGKGAKKYADRNWEKGYDWGLSYAAMQRHFGAFWAGEDYDLHNSGCTPECVEHTESHHLIAGIWHAVALFMFGRNHKDLDTRSKLK